MGVGGADLRRAVSVNRSSWFSFELCAVRGGKNLRGRGFGLLHVQVREFFGLNRQTRIEARFS